MNMTDFFTLFYDSPISEALFYYAVYEPFFLITLNSFVSNGMFFERVFIIFRSSWKEGATLIERGNYRKLRHL